MAAWLPCTPTSRRHARDLSESPEAKANYCERAKETRGWGARGSSAPGAPAVSPRTRRHPGRQQDTAEAEPARGRGGHVRGLRAIKPPALHPLPGPAPRFPCSRARRHRRGSGRTTATTGEEPYPPWRPCCRAAVPVHAPGTPLILVTRKTNTSGQANQSDGSCRRQPR